VLETKERKRLALSSHDHPAVPALKIARLGVSTSFRETHAGAGTALVRIALHPAGVGAVVRGALVLHENSASLSVPTSRETGVRGDRYVLPGGVDHGAELSHERRASTSTATSDICHISARDVR